MGLSTNTTCDIYRTGTAPPAAPAVAGVRIFLKPDWRSSHVESNSLDDVWRWTHIALMPLGTDVRDGSVDSDPNQEQAAVGWDTVWVPDKNGTKFQVIFVERTGYNSGNDLKKVYLQRGLPPWPTNNL